MSSPSHRIAVIAQIVIYKDGKFLLTKRKVEYDDDPKWDGYWQIPTGTVNFGEDIKDAVVREAKEELGIDVDLERTLAVTQKVDHIEGWHGVFMAFLCRQVHPLQEVKINHESYDFGWYTLDAIKVLPKLIPSTMDVLKYVYLYYRLFEIGALAVIRKGDKFLMTKVNAPHDTQVHGKWGFIAGMSEPYETLEQTLKRECLEEVGINVETQHMIPFVKEEDNFKLFCYVVHMTDTSQPIVINHEATEWGWFDLYEASELDTFGDTLKILSLVV